MLNNLEMYQLTEELKKEKEKQVIGLMKNHLVLSWLNKYQKGEELVRGNSQMFKRYLQSLETCNKCQGLSLCSVQPQGFTEELVFIDNLNFVLKPCRYNIDKLIGHKKYFLYCDLPDSWLLNEFSTLNISTPKFAVALREIDDNLINNKGKGLFLYGNVGVGKTHLLSCIANYYAKRKYKVCFFNMNMLSNRAKSYIQTPNLIADLLNDMQKCDILIIDDIGASKVSEWIRDDWLTAVLNSRLENKKLTYISSNLDYGGLRKYFTTTDGRDLEAVRLMERIEALTEPVLIQGKNMRREK